MIAATIKFEGSLYASEMGILVELIGGTVGIAGYFSSQLAQNVFDNLISGRIKTRDINIPLNRAWFQRGI